MMQLKPFQQEAVDKLLKSFDQEGREVVLKSCTGSGKTIMLAFFIEKFLEQNAGVVFVWLTPGKGGLEEQSKEKMERYVPRSAAKLLEDVMVSGFAENDACFINWEKLTKKGNNALKESEYRNFPEHIRAAKMDGLKFVVVVDESHQNDTVKADDIINYFDPVKIIRCSATPKGYVNPILIEIPENRVIAEELIKRVIVVNEAIADNTVVENEVEFLLDKALAKREELRAEFLRLSVGVNPLVIIQMPNRSDALIRQIEDYLQAKGITYGGGGLAVWLSGKRINTEGIEENGAPQAAVIIKQAVAVGWDCPRAHILVKLRENMGDTFEIQTIGRIRRMPEARHYETPLLDSCYLYTLDSKFAEGVYQQLGDHAVKMTQLFLKKEHRAVKLVKEQKSSSAQGIDARYVLKTITSHYRKRYHCGTRTKENSKLLQGYYFSQDVRKRFAKGEIEGLQDFARLDTAHIYEPLSTHTHGRDYHKWVHELGGLTGVGGYEKMNVIIRRLFDKNAPYEGKLLRLDTREAYAFVINNIAQLKEDFGKAMTDIALQQELASEPVIEREFRIPLECKFTYNARSMVQEVYDKNVYEGYLSSAAPRSGPEKQFEHFFQENAKIRWFYKNGDKGGEYLSVVYADNFGKQRSFYPDYVVGTENGVWVMEAKGGWDKSGTSQDIDGTTALKFEVLKSYIGKNFLRGGIVRFDSESQEWFICIDTFSLNLGASSWQLLKHVL